MGVDHFARSGSQSRATSFMSRYSAARKLLPAQCSGVDEEARELWVERQRRAEPDLAIPGLKDNFWAMGDTGPCGPCSEIHYDMGPVASDQGHTDCRFPLRLRPLRRNLELGLHAIQPRCSGGTLTPLPKPSIDTGMGLERLAAVLQGSHFAITIRIFCAADRARGATDRRR